MAGASCIEIASLHAPGYILDPHSLASDIGISTSKFTEFFTVGVADIRVATSQVYREPQV